MQEKLIVNLSSEEEIRATVPDINYIPAYKVAEEERRANELERISNENERIEYYEEVRRDVENGEFDGKNTVYVGETEPTDDFYEVWINPEGTPTVEAENIIMEDGETLQDKYENGELKGPKGDTPDLTDYATKEYVENEIATFDFIKVVDELPEIGLENRIYFVPKTDTQTQDLFDEYVWINGAWEWVTTKQLEVDLTPYYKKSETYSKTEINDKIVNTQSNSQTDTYSCDYINNKVHQDITTGGSPAKCGYQIDGKDVYVKIVDFGEIPDATSKTTDTGLSSEDTTIVDFEGFAKSTSGVCMKLPYAAVDNTTNNISLSLWIDNSINSYVAEIRTGSDRSSFTAYIKIYFTYKN